MAWHGMGCDAFRRGNPGPKSRSAPAAEELLFETSYSVQGCDYFVHLSIFAIACIGNGLPSCRI